jgi:hypothetical protein
MNIHNNKKNITMDQLLDIINKYRPVLNNSNFDEDIYFKNNIEEL